MAARYHHSVSGAFQRIAQTREASEVGDTLIEILLALTIMGLTVVALLGAFTTSISASAVHKDQAQLDSVLKSFVEQTQQQLGRQTSPLLFEEHCQGLTSQSTYSGLTLTAGTNPVYTANLTGIKYWSTTTSPPSWAPSCVDQTSSGTPPAQQLLTATACRGSGPCSSTSVDSQNMDFVVADPAYSSQPSPPTWCAPLSDTVAAGSTNDTFLVSTCNSGKPVPSLSLSNTPTPPPWVRLRDNNDGTGTLTFNPPSNITSQTPFTFNLVATNTTNGVLNQVTTSFTVTVDVAPSFNPPFSATVPRSFTINVSTTGDPHPTLTESDPLPPGATNFTDKGDGTGTLTGTAAPGTYTITFGATNPVGSTSMTFTLTVTNTVVNPTISTVNPNCDAKGTTPLITVTGTGFQAGLTATTGALTNISVTNVTSTSFTLTGTVVAPSPGNSQTFSLMVTNPDTGSATQAAAIKVVNNLSQC